MEIRLEPHRGGSAVESENLKFNNLTICDMMMTRHLFHCVKLAFRMHERDGEKIQGILQKKIAKAYHVKNYFSFSSSVIFQFSFFPPSHPSTASEISVHDESHGTHLKNIFPPSPKCG